MVYKHLSDQFPNGNKLIGRYCDIVFTTNTTLILKLWLLDDGLLHLLSISTFILPSHLHFDLRTLLSFFFPAVLI